MNAKLLRKLKATIDKLESLAIHAGESGLHDLAKVVTRAKVSIADHLPKPVVPPIPNTVGTDADTAQH